MTSALPHSSIVARQMEEYLNDLSDEVASSAHDLRESAQYRGIFRVSLGAYAVFRAFARNERLPLLRCAAGVVRRLPLLLACRQVSLAYVDLRRFVELIIWYPYFRDHPVEWDELRMNPGRGFTNDPEAPIAWCAHREFRWYVKYAKERFVGATSCETRKAIERLSTRYGALSAFVHAAVTISLPSGPFDHVDDGDLRGYQSVQRDVLAAASILSASARPRGLAKLNAVERAWFNWLIGRDRARRISGTSLGVAQRGRKGLKSRTPDILTCPLKTVE